MKAKEIFENKYIHIAVLAIVAVLLYSISWHYELYRYLDDGFYILHNEHLGFNLQNIMRWLKQPCVGLFVPVTMFSFMFDYNIWGLDSFGYHLQNIFWFVITIIAIYACFTKLKLKPWHAFVLVLIYAVHPQRVESVVWITERKDVLFGAFFFIALFFFLDRFEKDKFNFVTFFLYILALFSKPMAISLPVVLVMIDFSRKRQFSPVYYSKKYWPYVLVIIAYMIIIINLKHDFVKAQTDYTHMFSVMLFNIYWYTKTAFIPDFYNMSVLYPKIVFTWQIIMEMLVFYAIIVGSGIIAFVKLKKETLLYSVLPVIVCYIAVLSPVLGGFQFSSPDYADRYSYMPSVFLLFATGCLAPLLINSRTRKTITLLATIYIIILTYFTIMYIPHWKNNTTLFTRSFKTRSGNIKATYTLGMIKAKTGQYLAAMILAKKLREDYLNDSFKMPRVAHAAQLYITALILFKNEKKERALKIFQEMSRDKDLTDFIMEIGEGVTFYSMMADCYLKKRMVGKAVLCFKELLKSKAIGTRDRLFYKGMSAFFEKRKQEALEYFEKAHQLYPEDKNIKYNLQRVRELLRQEKTTLL